MKKSIALIASLFAFSAFAQELQIPYFDGQFVGDIAQQGLRKEQLFSKMQDRLIKDESICANRAHMWSYDFERFYKADSAKVFIFYTPKTSRSSGESWWYHVAPVINENGKFFAMDKTFFDSPVTVDKWVQNFANSSKKCYEIKNEDTDLIQRMFITMPFPVETAHGKFDCYYKITPSTIWFPIGIPLDILKQDQKGNAISFTLNDKIPAEEVLQACIEASERDVKKPSENTLRKARERCTLYLNAKEPGATKLPL